MTVESAEKDRDDLRAHIENFQPDREDNVKTMADHAIKTVNDTSWWNIPQHISNWWNDVLKQIEELLNVFKQQAAKAAAWLRDNIAPWLAGPVVLAQSWVRWQEVAQQASIAEGGISLDQVKGAIDWSGPAARAYESTVENQKKAAGLTVTMIQKWQTFLNDHLNNILVHLLHIIAELIKLKEEIIVLVAQFIAVFDPTNWKEIIKSAGKALAQAAAAQDKALKGLIEYIQKDINNMAAIQQESLDVYRLPGGAAGWPEPLANIDANVPGGWSAK